MRLHPPLIALVSWAGLVGVAPPAARAAPADQVRLCVSFRATGLGEVEGYRRLVIDELRRFPTHVPVARDCDIELRLEYIGVAGSGTITGQVGRSVPHRLKVAKVTALAGRIRELIAILLKRDPVVLVNNLQASGLLAPPRLSLLHHGRYFWGFEFFGLMVKLSRPAPWFMPGAAFRFRKTVDRWYLGARIGFGYNPDPIRKIPPNTQANFTVSAQGEVGMYFWPRSWAAVYLAGLVGVRVVKVTGMTDPSYDLPGEYRREYFAFLFALSARLGVELMRLYSVRLDIFGQVDIPLHKSHDVNYGVLNAYTPTVMFGVGVAF